MQLEEPQSEKAYRSFMTQALKCAVATSLLSLGREKYSELRGKIVLKNAEIAKNYLFLLAERSLVGPNASPAYTDASLAGLCELVDRAVRVARATETSGPEPDFSFCGPQSSVRFYPAPELSKLLDVGLHLLLFADPERFRPYGDSFGERDDRTVEDVRTENAISLASEKRTESAILALKRKLNTPARRKLSSMTGQISTDAEQIKKWEESARTARAARASNELVLATKEFFSDHVKNVRFSALGDPESPRKFEPLQIDVGSLVKVALSQSLRQRPNLDVAEEQKPQPPASDTRRRSNRNYIFERSDIWEESPQSSQELLSQENLPSKGYSFSYFSPRPVERGREKEEGSEKEVEEEKSAELEKPPEIVPNASLRKPIVPTALFREPIVSSAVDPMFRLDKKTLDLSLSRYFIFYLSLPPIDAILYQVLDRRRALPDFTARFEPNAVVRGPQDFRPSKVFPISRRRTARSPFGLVGKRIPRRFGTIVRRYFQDRVGFDSVPFRRIPGLRSRRRSS
jgi:hypothetical protein